MPVTTRERIRHSPVERRANNARPRVQARVARSIGSRYVVVAVAMLVLATTARPAWSAGYPDRFVWIFGWNLTRESHVADIEAVLERASQHGINGAVMSLGLDTLCKKSPEYFRRLERVQGACRRNDLELIPAVFSVGYGGAALSHNRNLAAGLPVVEAPFVAEGGVARLVPEEAIGVVNGGFEEYSGNRLAGYRFHDKPGVVSFVDTEVRHGGEASLRLENFGADEHGHGRVMQEVSVRPHRCYRVSLWVKTEGLEPARAFRVQVLAGDRALAPREFGDLLISAKTGK